MVIVRTVVCEHTKNLEGEYFKWEMLMNKKNWSNETQRLVQKKHFIKLFIKFKDDDDHQCHVLLV